MERLDEIYHDFYKYFVESIDAGDNGIDYIDDDARKNYVPVILSSTVASFNGNPDDPEEQMLQFHAAVEYCSQTFREHLKETIRRKKQYYDGQRVYQQSLIETADELKELGILVISEPIPIEPYLKTDDPSQHYKFIAILPRIMEGGQVKLWTVNKRGKKFETLVKLISEEDARSLVGDDLVFVHKAGFTGATTTLDAAVEIFKASLLVGEDHAPPPPPLAVGSDVYIVAALVATVVGMATKITFQLLSS
jgi:uncharacterized UPF0160 family protein